MRTCSDCKERDRAWGYIKSYGHCEYTWCENYIESYKPTIITTIKNVNQKQNLKQQSILKYLGKMDLKII